MAGLLDAIRTAILRSNDTPGAIATRAGLPRSAVSRLLAGKTVTVDGAEKLAAALGLTIRVEPKLKTTKGRVWRT